MSWLRSRKDGFNGSDNRMEQPCGSCKAFFKRELLAVTRLSGDLFGVGVGGEEGLGFFGFCEFEFEEPAFAVGIGVDEGGVGDDGVVNGGDLPADWSVDVAGGFDGFDYRAGFAGFYFPADGREFDKDNVGEFVLGVVGDAYGGYLALSADPFVRFGVSQIRRDV